MAVVNVGTASNLLLGVLKSLGDKGMRSGVPEADQPTTLTSIMWAAFVILQIWWSKQA